MDGLYTFDSFHIDANTHERTVSAHLARHLISVVHGRNYTVDVDSDHNRMGPRSAVSGPVDSAPESDGANQITKRVTDDDGVERDVFPDVIVHRRTSTTCNLLAIEVCKADSSTAKQKRDLTKLRHYGRQLGYQKTVLVVLERPPLWQWLEPGASDARNELALEPVPLDTSAPQRGSR
ncbi:hypothetical protein ACFWUP_21770 [Nocardia sp. NPDC058658]|uniref:hypothetical protein n=1 Tax=Nocardia sp. NPDC058658 TaxID=3346580 RepID=UPI0036528E6F